MTQSHQKPSDIVMGTNILWPQDGKGPRSFPEDLEVKFGIWNDGPQRGRLIMGILGALVGHEHKTFMFRIQSCGLKVWEGSRESVALLPPTRLRAFWQ